MVQSSLLHFSKYRIRKCKKFADVRTRFKLDKMVKYKMNYQTLLWGWDYVENCFFCWRFLFRSEAILISWFRCFSLINVLVRANFFISCIGTVGCCLCRFSTSSEMTPLVVFILSEWNFSKCFSNACTVLRKSSDGFTRPPLESWVIHGEESSWTRWKSHVLVPIMDLAWAGVNRSCNFSVMIFFL